MERTVEERLFFKMMHFSHMVRRNMMEKKHGPCGGHEMSGPHTHGHGPCGGHEMSGPHTHGRGPCGGPGMHGHGMHTGGPHGPIMHGHGMRRAMRKQAFAQARLLSLLAEKEGGVRQKVLAEEMRINPSSTSELISKLESEGYVARSVDPDDKRATLIELTEVGRARAYELEDERHEKFASVFEPLTAEEKEQLLKLLEKLVPTPVRPAE